MTSVDHAVTNSMSRFIDPLQSVPFLSFLHRVSSFNIFLDSTHLMFQTWWILQKNSSYSKYRLVAFQLNISQFPMQNMLNQLYFSTKTSRNKKKKKNSHKPKTWRIMKAFINRWYPPGLKIITREAPDNLRKDLLGVEASGLVFESSESDNNIH